MQCSVKINGEYAVVSSNEKTDTLKLDFSSHYCKIFESAKQQSRDYLDELLRWCGTRPENLESLNRSLHMFLLVRRQQIGLKN